MPTGSIFGKVSTPYDPATSITFAAAFSMDMPGSEEPYRVAAITTSDGSYSIENLPGGDYMLLAVQDINGDSQINDSDLLVFYDSDGDAEPDPVSVSERQATGSLDFQLTTLNVTSSYPADSTLNVPTDTTLSVTFNLPVDYQNQDFEAQIFPAPDDRGPLSAGPDGKTIFIPVILQENTLYHFFLTGAQTFGEPSQNQIEPYLVSFTTGSAFPTASISGSVTFADFTPLVAVSFLVPPDWQGDEGDITNVTLINRLDGSYMMSHVAPGIYYPSFFSDFEGTEIVVQYPDSVLVDERETIEDINITMALGADISLFGRITGSGGISDVEIEAYNTTEEREFRGQSNFLGNYRLNISEGLYDLRLYPQRDGTYIEREIRGLAISSDTELPITLERGFFIFGVVSDPSSAPVPEVKIGVDETATHDFVNGGITDEMGKYRNTITWDGTTDLGSPVTSGVYIYRIEAGKYVQGRKLLLMR